MCGQEQRRNLDGVFLPSPESQKRVKNVGEGAGNVKTSSKVKKTTTNIIKTSLEVLPSKYHRWEFC